MNQSATPKDFSADWFSLYGLMYTNIVAIFMPISRDNSNSLYIGKIEIFTPAFGKCNVYFYIHLLYIKLQYRNINSSLHM